MSDRKVAHRIAAVQQFIQEFIADNARLGEIITRQYLV